MDERNVSENKQPAGGLSTAKMPGHWLLARLGKRVLRPGGLELTRRMLAALDVRSSDEVVEFAPGLGTTARIASNRRPPIRASSGTRRRPVRWAVT